MRNLLRPVGRRAGVRLARCRPIQPPVSRPVGDPMKLIKSIVRPDKVDIVKDALAKLNISGMTVSEVRGHGKQKGHTAIYRGQEYNVSLLPKLRSEERRVGKECRSRWSPYH